MKDITPEPLYTTTVVHRIILVRNNDLERLSFELPKLGLLYRIELQCSNGRKYVQQVRLDVNDVTIFKLPWPLDKKRKMSIPVGIAESNGIVGLLLQNQGTDVVLILHLAPGEYQVEFRLITQWMPVRNLAKE